MGENGESEALLLREATSCNRHSNILQIHAGAHPLFESEKCKQFDWILVQITGCQEAFQSRETSCQFHPQVVFECSRQNGFQRAKESSGFDCPLGQDDQPKTRIHHEKSFCGRHPVLLSLCQSEDDISPGKASCQFNQILDESKYEQNGLQTAKTSSRLAP